ncbi:dihydroorotate dehydrogenase [Rhodobacter sp. CCP-1]|uniref:Dihydroorotate dehydrogenase n=2 Tax=Paragemmobacter ruber TaxID=1985673 RepID=A0ABW9Y1L6_9RHOB|nr:dihydroorotate dehydrogenase [Rhodobacter ruber]
MRAQDDLEDLFATARHMPVRPSAALLDRVLADGLDAQPRPHTAPLMRPPAAAAGGLWSRLAALFGGAGALAGMGTAAAAGLLIGFAQPSNLATLEDAMLGSPLETVELVPSVDGFLVGN